MLWLGCGRWRELWCGVWCVEEGDRRRGGEGEGVGRGEGEEKGA